MATSLKALLAARSASAPAADTAKPQQQVPSASQSKGIVIRPETAAAPAPAAKQPEPELRLLGDAKPDVPFDFPSAEQSEGERLWVQMLRLPETSLGIWIEPTMEGAWLALRCPQMSPNGRPILLHRLRVLNELPEPPF